MRLAREGVEKISDMKFGGDIGVFINKNMKLKYKEKSIKLSDITPEFYIPVLNYLRNYLEVWGKYLFMNFTFTF